MSENDNPSGLIKGQVLFMILPFNKRKDITNKYNIKEFGHISCEKHPYIVHSVTPRYVKLIQCDSVKQRETKKYHAMIEKTENVLGPKTIIPTFDKPTIPRFDKSICIENFKELRNYFFLNNQNPMKDRRDKNDKKFYEIIIENNDKYRKTHHIYPEDKLFITKEQFFDILRKAESINQTRQDKAPVQNMNFKLKHLFQEALKRKKEETKIQTNKLPDQKNKYKVLAII